MPGDSSMQPCPPVRQDRFTLNGGEGPLPSGRRVGAREGRTSAPWLEIPRPRPLTPGPSPGGRGESAGMPPSSGRRETTLPVRYNTFRKRGGRLDFDFSCPAEAEHRRRGNGITGVGAVVPATRTPGTVGSKSPLGPRAFHPREYPQANGSPQASHPRSRDKAPTEYAFPPGSGYARTRSK